MSVGAVLLLLSAAAFPLSADARTDYERAVERARYVFVIGNTKPFDEVYPRAIFAKRVAKEIGQERVLAREFGVAVTPDVLAQEFDRIEKTTKAPEQWDAIKKALGNDRRLIEDIFCRPLLVDRALRAKFAFDQKIHAGPHQQAREARAAFLAGKTPAGAKVIVLARKSASPPTTEDLLAHSKAEASLPRVLAPTQPGDPDPDDPIRPDPEVAAVLERQLQKPGDVTTIFEEREQFEILRLLAIKPESWRVEAVRFPKTSFDSWFEKQARKTSRASKG